jgi:hypothetical protein
MKIWITFLFILVGCLDNAQVIEHEGVSYEIKGKAIFKDGVDVTQTLSAEKQKAIMGNFEKSQKATKKLAKDQEAFEKKLKKNEKDLKKAEKDRKKSEKTLKQKQQAQDNFEKANKNMVQTQEKYDKLKQKGKLSPKDEEKWLKKIEKHKDDGDCKLFCVFAFS